MLSKDLNVITMIPAPGWRVFDCIWDNGGACYEMPVVGFAGMIQNAHFINKIVVWDDELREAFTLDDDLICCDNTHFVVVPPGVGPEDTEKLKQEGIERAHHKVQMDEAREEGIAEATPKVLAALLAVHPHGRPDLPPAGKATQRRLRLPHRRPTARPWFGDRLQRLQRYRLPNRQGSQRSPGEVR